MSEESTRGGIIAWLVDNRVTPNILMLILLLGGLFVATQIRQEIFPEFEADSVQVVVSYPGASPESVESAIVLALEEAMGGVEGVEELRANASQGRASVTAEVREGAELESVAADIEQAVDGIRTFPQAAEEPEISSSTWRRDVLRLELHGEADRAAMTEAARRIERELLADPDITEIEIDGTLAPEIHVEPDAGALERLDLTLAELAERVSARSAERAGGEIETREQAFVVRIDERRETANALAQLVIATTDSGSPVRLGEVATVRPAFEDTDRIRTYEGETTLSLQVYRVGEQTPVEVSEAVHARLEGLRASLPDSLSLAVAGDQSEV